jgi:hypothetical protein
MSPTNGHVSPTSARSLLLFGPQQNQISASDLSNLRALIREVPDLTFLRNTVRELQSSWATIVHACPILKKVPGEESLIQLRSIIDGDEPVNAKQFVPTSNILTDSITVVAHIVGFWRLATTSIRTGIFPCPSTEGNSSPLGDVHGFCIGFLTAAAVATSPRKSDF